MSIAEHSFLGEKWLTPIQIARAFGYSTDKPIRKAIMRGELKATRAPCGRKLLVAESEVQLWIDRTLVFEPRITSPDQARSAEPSTRRGRRRSGMPRLSYDTSSRPSS